MIRILLVEDDINLARTTERLIHRTLTVSHEVVHRTTAEQAIVCLALAGDDAYTLVISDFNLAGPRTGGDVLDFVRGMRVQPAFIFVTSDDDADGHDVPRFSKPCSISDLRSAVLTAIDPPKVVIEIPFDDIAEVA